MRQSKSVRQSNRLERARKAMVRSIVLDNLHKPDPLGTAIQSSHAYGNVPTSKYGAIRVIHNHFGSMAKGANPAVTQAKRAATKRINKALEYMYAPLPKAVSDFLLDNPD